MSIDLILAVLAVICFVLALLGVDQGKGVPAGLLFLTLLIAF